LFLCGVIQRANGGHLPDKGRAAADCRSVGLIVGIFYILLLAAAMPHSWAIDSIKLL
jgi:hypothetical protein